MLFWNLRYNQRIDKKNCSNNVQIKIHIDHVLNEPIVIRRGNAENHVRIIIHSNREVSHNWTKKTWATTFWDWLCRFADSLKIIGELIISAIRRTVRKIMFIDVLRLQYYWGKPSIQTKWTLTRGHKYCIIYIKKSQICRTFWPSSCTKPFFA